MNRQEIVKGMEKKKKSIKTCGIAILILNVLCIASLHAQTYNPSIYYTFDNTNPLADDMGTGNLDPVYYSSPYSISPAQSSVSTGKYLTLNSSSKIIRGSSFTPDSGLTVEFLLRPGFQFEGQDILWSQNGCFGIRMGFPYITFNTTVFTSGNVQVNDAFKIDLTDVGRKTFGYYIDGNWHHIVLRMIPKTGVKEVWVDGQCPSGFSKTISTINCHFKAGTYNSLYINTNTSSLTYRGDLDELAFYKYALHPNMIYKHYQNFLAHSHYNFIWTNVAPPPADPITGSIDLNEFAPGHPTPTVNMIDQLKSFPGARFKPGNTLLRNGTFVNYGYLGGRFWPGISDAQAVANSVEIQKQLFKNYNYTIQVSGAATEWAQFGDTTKFSGAWIKLANDNPTIPTSINTAWPHVDPSMAGYKASETYTTCQCLPNSSYLQNAAGQFIDATGAVTTSKILAPDAPQDSIVLDGLTTKFYFTKLFQKLNRSLDFILDESENLPMLRTAHAGPPLDPSVLAQKNASGLDWYTYYGRKYAGFTKTYRDNFMNLPQLANTKYQLYETEGHDDYRQKYSEMRTINSLTNGKYYPVASMYTRYPWNWRYNSSAWNGWQWFVESRANEFAAGDSFCTPAVSAGWDIDEEVNVRPAQWLGFNKALAMAGAENFIPAYFVLGGSTLQNPSNYVWEMVIPAYAQSITSRYEDVFKNGKLLAGDVPLIETNPTGAKGYSFKAGDPRKLVVVRKHNTLVKYAITGSIQPNSNMLGNAELEGPAEINLDGQTLKFKIRRQGSTYIYDKTNATSPVFYQLDGWQESSHPYNWSKDFNIEGELFDNANTNLVIKTEVPVGTSTGDYTNFTSYIHFNAVSDATYNFAVRGLTSSTYYFWIRARAASGTSSLNVKLDNGTTYTINNVTQGWNWYRVNTATGQPIVFSNVSVNDHFIKVTAGNANLEIDKICLSIQGGNIFATPSMISPIISLNGDSTLCLGETVTLTCDSGLSYLWSNGQTNRSINVMVAGSYYATITGSNGVSIKTDTVVIIVNWVPTAGVTASGSLNICSPATVTLTVDSAYAYSWSTGATTRSIVVSSAGTYTATTTNKKGCSKTSSPVVVTSSNCCPVPTNVSVSNITTTSAVFSWQAPAGLTGFSYKYTNIVSGNSWVSTLGGAKRSVTVTNLGPSKTYSFIIQSMCSTTLSNTSDTVTFSTPALKQLNSNTDPEFQIALYPNPASDQIFITFNSDINATSKTSILNSQGQLIYSKNSNAEIGMNTFTFDTDTYAQGVYNVEMVIGDKVQHLRFIKN